MTFGEKLAHVAQDDPKFARSVRRLRWAGWLFGIGLAAALFLGVASNVINFEQGTTIDRLSACEHDPAGELCQRIKRESDEARSIKDTCRNFWKVGYPCPRPGSGVTVASAEHGSASQSVHAAHQPAPATGGAPAIEHVGGSEHHASAETPPKQTPAPASNPAATPTPAPAQTPASAQPAPQAEPEAPPAVEPTPTPNVPGLLGNPGDTVGEVLCSVNALGIRICSE